MVALRAIVAFAAVLQGAGAVSTLRRVAVEADGDDKAAAAPTGVGKATLAPGGLETSRIGYGGLHFAALDGELPHSRARALGVQGPPMSPLRLFAGPETLQKLLHACLDNGITMLGTCQMRSIVYPPSPVRQRMGMPMGKAARGSFITAKVLSSSITDLADIYGYNKSAELVGKTFKLEPGLREKFQINYKVQPP
jgi:hypothetical protein